MLSPLERQLFLMFWRPFCLTSLHVLHAWCVLCGLLERRPIWLELYHHQQIYLPPKFRKSGRVQVNFVGVLSSQRGEQANFVTVVHIIIKFTLSGFGNHKAQFLQHFIKYHNCGNNDGDDQNHHYLNRMGLRYHHLHCHHFHRAG